MKICEIYLLQVNYMQEETDLGQFYRRTNTAEAELDVKILTKR